MLFTPIIIFSIIWSVTLFLYILNPFQLAPIREYTIFVITLGISMVYVGFYTPKFLTNGINIRPQYNISTVFPFDINKLRNIVIILSILSFIGTAGNIKLIFDAVGGYETFITDPTYVRRFILDLYLGEGNVPINRVLFKIFSYLSSLISITIILAGAISTKKGSKLISIFPLFIVLLITLLNLQRYTFIQHYFYWLISSYVFTYYYPQKEQKLAIKSFVRQLLAFVILSFVLALLILGIRLLLAAGIDVEKVFQSFYFYIAGNIFSLDKYLLKDTDPYYGVSLFRAFIRWFAAFGLVDESLIMSPHYEFYKLYNTTGNTFGFFRVPYEDFGLFGIIIIPYIWGWLGFSAMKAYVKKFTFVRLGIVVFLMFSFFLSFFGFTLTGITSITWKLLLFSIVDKLTVNKFSNSFTV